MIADSASALAAAGIAAPTMPAQDQPSAPSGPAPIAPPDAGPKKTMMLDGSEGVVSFAKHGDAATAPAPPVVKEEATENTTIPEEAAGATPLFWAICIMTGLGVGVLAYLAVLSLG